MTYEALSIPGARALRRCGYDAEMEFLKAHNRELARCNARAGNWGWVISETGIASKTSQGILETDVRDGSITHTWHARNDGSWS